MAIIRTSGYDRVLIEIHTMVAALAESVQDILRKALVTLEKPEQQEDWRTLDQAIDQARTKIIDRIIDIMSLQQLRTQELRFMLGHQRMAQGLERIADYACDIAELSRLRSDAGWPPEIMQMSGCLLNMFEHVLIGLKGEQELQVDLDEEDDQMDQNYASLQKELRVNDQSKSISVELGLALVMARTLERLGDHIVNVGEMQVYIKTGHRRLREQE